MSPPLTIHYHFSFPHGETRDIHLQLDAETLSLLNAVSHEPPLWAKLASNQCKWCPLDPDLQPYCPTAVHVEKILEMFRDHHSYEEVTVEVKDKMRLYLKETSLQDGLGSMLGIIMTTGGCPVLKPLRPMVRFHLPFASVEETQFRMVSMYLVAQFLRYKRGEQADWSLDGLQAIYDRIRDVNKSFVRRIRAASGSDAGVNAVIILDCFASAIPEAIRNMLKGYEKYFEPCSPLIEQPHNIPNITSSAP